MKNSLILLHLSALSFAMLPVGIARESNLWVLALSICVVLPLMAHVGLVVWHCRRTRTDVMKSLFSYSYNGWDIVIAALGILNCIFEGLYILSLIWVVSLFLICVELYLKRRKQ